jgi:hypothetical protein
LRSNKNALKSTSRCTTPIKHWGAFLHSCWRTLPSRPDYGGNGKTQTRQRSRSLALFLSVCFLDEETADILDEELESINYFWKRNELKQHVDETFMLLKNFMSLSPPPNAPSGD